MVQQNFVRRKTGRNYGEENMAYLSTGPNAQTKTGEMTFDDAKFKAGTSSSTVKPMGLIDIDTTAVGTGADTNETDLITFSLPADSLSADGKVVRITAWGNTAANGNTKTIRLKFGAEEIRAIGPSAINGLDWRIDGLVIRTGATTQDAMATESLDAAAQDTTITTPAETLSGAVVIKITGENGSAAANDIVCEGMMIEFLN